MFKPQTDWLKQWSVYTPNSMVLREHQRDLRWTYADMNKRIDALARYLAKNYNLKKGDRIAVYSLNRAEYFFLFFASIRLGTILVPLNFRLMPPELNVLIRDSNPSLFVYEKKFSDQLELLDLSKVKTTEEIENIEKFMTQEVSDTPFECDTPEFDDIVMILYTSGTTGLPKGVIINHRMIYWNSVNTILRLSLTSEDHTQSYAPLFHVGGWNVLFTPMLHVGGSHTLLNSFEPDLLLELMEKEKTTIFFGVPTMLQMLADSPRFKEADLSSVRYSIVGGAPMPTPLIDIWHKKGVYIRQGYGLTEVGPNCFSLSHEDAYRKKGSIGFPNFYLDARIEGDDGKEADLGELLLRSDVVTPGYWNKEKETQETIVDGWLHTGDVVRRDSDGYFYVVDRKKNMFISGGENVYPAAIEAFLVTHKAIREVAVIGVADERWGEVGHAFVVPEAGSDLDAQGVLSFCKGQLAKYKIPKHISFLKELPRNEAGKIDRLKLFE